MSVCNSKTWKWILSLNFNGFNVTNAKTTTAIIYFNVQVILCVWLRNELKINRDDYWFLSKGWRQTVKHVRWTAKSNHQKNHTQFKWWLDLVGDRIDSYDMRWKTQLFFLLLFPTSPFIYWRYGHFNRCFTILCAVGCTLNRSVLCLVGHFNNLTLIYSSIQKE